MSAIARGVHAPIRSAVHSPMGRGGGVSLPRMGLLYLNTGSGDTIGVSGILFSSGDTSDLMAAEYSFIDSPDMRTIDTLLGGDIFFDSGDDMAPIVRYGFDWASIDNVNYLFVGYVGIAGYNISQSANIYRLIRVLLLPTVMFDDLEMLDNLRVVQ